MWILRCRMKSPRNQTKCLTSRISEVTQTFSRKSKSSGSKFSFVHVRKNAGTSLIEYFHGLKADIEVIYDAESRSDRVIFGVCRNPYDRCLSSWKYCHSTKHRPLLEVLNSPPSEGHDYRHFTRTQWSYLNTADRILRFESLYDDVIEFFDEYGVETYGRVLPKLNVGNHPTIESLSTQERDAIYEFYCEDFENLGYDRYDPRQT